jgi:hypothetical protein
MLALREEHRSSELLEDLADVMCDSDDLSQIESSSVAAEDTNYAKALPQNILAGVRRKVVDEYSRAAVAAGRHQSQGRVYSRGPEVWDRLLPELGFRITRVREVGS